MSAWLRPICGWLASVLSILATSTGWSSWAVLFEGTLRPVSGQNWATLWPPSTCCGAAASPELEEPPAGASRRLGGGEAEQVRTTPRPRGSPSLGGHGSG